MPVLNFVERLGTMPWFSFAVQPLTGLSWTLYRLQTAQFRVEGLMANQSLQIRLTELDFAMNQTSGNNWDWKDFRRSCPQTTGHSSHHRLEYQLRHGNWFFWVNCLILIGSGHKNSIQQLKLSHTFIEKYKKLKENPFSWTAKLNRNRTFVITSKQKMKKLDPPIYTAEVTESL